MRRYLPILLLLAQGCSETPEPENTAAITISPDGAWCWFQDPRAVFISGQHDRTYAGWMTHDGSLEVGSYDHETGEHVSVTLKEDWDVDDHNTNSFLVLPDNRLVVFYAQHNKQGLFLRISENPEDITAWGDEITVSDADKITYSHPVYLADEERYYVFWRGPSWKPTYSSSSDLVSWTEPRILIEETGREAGDIRPYLKVYSDNQSTIHFAFTDGHPRNEPTNSIYYMQYRTGNLHRADGSMIGALDDGPTSPADSDVVYNAKETRARAWVWDVGANESGHPVIAYTQLPDTTDHRYHVAAFDGTSWTDDELTPGGGWMPQTPEGARERELEYSGGIALSHADPDEVYLSRPVDGQFEIEKWTRSSTGWSGVAVTSGSSELNVRPVVPRGYGGESGMVLWMSGKYVHYTDYATAILGSQVR